MQNSAPQTFKKNERLKSRTDILKLMSEGRRVKAFPVLAKFSIEPLNGKDATQNRVMVVAPKKLFKRAVDRNLLKRRMREAYRQNKYLLPPCSAHISFSYIAKEKLPYSKIEAAVTEILKDIAKSFKNVSLNEQDSRQKETGSNRFWSALKKVANFPFVVLIKFYQICISPLKPSTCRFTPTCSQYAIEALRKYGPFKGLYLATRRVLRCHPWGGRGYDPVP